jgi:hypothetical protein
VFEQRASALRVARRQVVLGAARRSREEILGALVGCQPTCVIREL